jgi:hypothetical protein
MSPSPSPKSFSSSLAKSNTPSSTSFVQSSFEDISYKPYLATSNGFVNTAVQAYSKHHHLVLRPEDIWFSILVQTNLYINVHAEDLRAMFVAHEGMRSSSSKLLFLLVNVSLFVTLPNLPEFG